MTLDMTKLEPLLGTMVNELGAAANAALVLTGDKLGLFRALAKDGPLTSAGLAAKTGTHERYIREWLAAQAASGFVTYEAAVEGFSLSPEQAAVFADEESRTLCVRLNFRYLGHPGPIPMTYLVSPRTSGPFVSLEPSTRQPEGTPPVTHLK